MLKYKISKMLCNLKKEKDLNVNQLSELNKIEFKKEKEKKRLSNCLNQL